MSRLLPCLLALLLVVGCESIRDKPELSSGHVQATAETTTPEEDIPPPVSVAPAVPAPTLEEEETVHTVVVYDVPVTELLFSLARDSELNLDVDGDIDATITMNAVDQPLTAVLDRIAESADLVYDLTGNTLRVQKDAPYLRSYKLDVLNMRRSSSGTVAVATQIQSAGANEIGNSGGAGMMAMDEAAAGNSSNTMVRINSDYDFWTSLTQNINAILLEGQITEEQQAPDFINPNIVINRESGVLAVRATQRQHATIQRFIDAVQGSIGKQVLIEATVAEVVLSDSYQAGIDWTLIQEEGTSGVGVNQTLVSEALQSPPSFVFNVTNVNQNDTLSATLTALETFGDVSVVSSPKVMAMNNQTAILKVVDNIVYFTIEVNIDNTANTIGQGRLTTFETEVFTVPVGFVMSVTPFVDDLEQVTLNVRPTISRVIDFVQDPNPALAEEDVVSEIPVIQVREVESVLKVPSGSIAVIGGLMQDEIQRNSQGVPLLGSLPLIGPAFRFDDDRTEKTELVIFIQPRVITSPSLEGDFEDFRRYLPDAPER